MVDKQDVSFHGVYEEQKREVCRSCKEYDDLVVLMSIDKRPTR